ncbi:MAG: hypothetical protein JSW11_02025 [Candidatus Heimdallarchaeota archaeon]|nr:MAG: hypothetical protein JSW11_02025 [Candidatus Heimdallarchaeota archaeon]
MIHPKIEEAFQEIDAAVFTGDDLEFYEFRHRLLHFAERWRKAALDKTLEIYKKEQSYDPRYGKSDLEKT